MNNHDDIDENAKRRNNENTGRSVNTDNGW